MPPASSFTPTSDAHRWVRAPRKLLKKLRPATRTWSLISPPALAGNGPAISKPPSPVCSKPKPRPPSTIAPPPSCLPCGLSSKKGKTKSSFQDPSSWKSVADSGFRKFLKPPERSSWRWERPIKRTFTITKKRSRLKPRSFSKSTVRTSTLMVSPANPKFLRLPDWPTTTGFRSLKTLARER